MAGNPVDTSYADAVAITLSDSTTYTPPLRALFVGTGGAALTIITPAGNSVTFGNVPSGTTVPINASKVMNTGTGVSNVVGFK